MIESALMSTELLRVRLRASAPLLPALTEFYAGHLELRLARPADSGLTLEVGETVLDYLAAGGGSPFYHFALLVPGDRFEAALAWADDRVELLPDPETGDLVFDFTNWDAKAAYFHDPAGSIVELIAHGGIGERGASGAFAAAELLGLSEVGIVCDPPAAAEELRRELGLELWDGTVDGEDAARVRRREGEDADPLSRRSSVVADGPSRRGTSGRGRARR